MLNVSQLWEHNEVKRKKKKNPDTYDNTIEHEATQAAAAEAEVHYFFLLLSPLQPDGTVVNKAVGGGV